MAAMPYWQQLKHPLWQRKRLEVFQRDGFMCQRCCAEDQPLHAHHKLYIKGRMAWEYAADDLTTLCDSCHESEHVELDEFRQTVAESGLLTADLTRVIRGMASSAQAGESARSHLRRLGHIESTGFIAANCMLLNQEQIEKVFVLIRQLFEIDAFGEVRTK